MRLGRNRQEGIVLLLVVMVGSILLVVVGQFTQAVLVDRSLAENHLRDLQARQDLAGVPALLGALTRQEQTSPFTLTLPSGQLRLTWEKEGGKFNLNNLRSPRYPQAPAQLERLFQRLEDGQKVSELGLCDQIVQLVQEGARPLLSLGELQKIQGVTPEVLDELSPYLTVYTDGRIDYREAEDEVLGCLDEGLGVGRQVDRLKEYLENPRRGAPRRIMQSANRLQPYLSTEGGAWRGMATLSGQALTRQVEVALRREGGQIKTVLFNEIDPVRGGEEDG